MSISSYQYNWETIPFEKVGDGIERQMIVGENIMICRLRFAANTVTPAHEHPHEQMTIVEKGKVLFTLNETQQVFQAGDVLHFPPNFWHGATMLEDEVILIDIFSPVREDFLQK